jgi:hypothetical protein
LAELDRRNVTVPGKLEESFPKAKASDKIICYAKDETFTLPISRHVIVKGNVYKSVHSTP